MTIDEAIKVNEDNIVFFEMDGYQECADAIKLGNEALKRHRDNKKRDYPKVYSLLPGETE